jgi:hypothetical protein
MDTMCSAVCRVDCLELHWPDGVLTSAGPVLDEQNCMPTAIAVIQTDAM